MKWIKGSRIMMNINKKSHFSNLNLFKLGRRYQGINFHPSTLIPSLSMINKNVQTSLQGIETNNNSKSSINQ